MFYIIITISIIYVIYLSSNSVTSKNDFHHSFDYILDKNKPEDLEIIRKLITHEIKGRVKRDTNSARSNLQDIKFLMYKDQYLMGKLFELASKSNSNSLQINSEITIAPQSRSHGLSSGKSANQLRQHVLLEYGVDLDLLIK
jgi:hypothetical protein